MSATLSREEFLRDVASHQMTVLHSQGLHRHIRFRRPDTMCMHFDLITWPGYLCYTGDMGTYVFSRLDDMLQFFRRSDRSYTIDFRYWAEKLQAVDASGGTGSATEFSRERFTRVINDYRIGWMKNSRDDLSKEQRRELWEAVQCDVLDDIDDSEEVLCAQAYNFNWGVGRVYSFVDLWDHRFTEYTHHFLWCCHALAWGVAKFDAEGAA